MKKIDYLNKLEKDYGLDKLVRVGILNWNICVKRQVYNEYDALRRVGVSSYKAALRVSGIFDIDMRTVWNYKKDMENEWKEL